MPRTSSSSENPTTGKPRARGTRSTRQRVPGEVEGPEAVTDRQTRNANGATTPNTAGNGAALGKTGGNGASAAAASEMPYSPSYDEIAEEAYQRYLRRGAQHGQDFDDWLEAERALKERRS